MLPFLPSFPYPFNQLQTGGSNGSAPQQVILSDSYGANSSSLGSNPTHQIPCSSCACHNPQASRNSSQFHSQLYPFNPQFPIPFNISDTYLSNLANRPPLMRSPCFLNVPSHHLPVQNGLGMPLLGSGAATPNLAQSHGRFCSPNTLQNLNPFASFPVRGQFSSGNPMQTVNQLVPMQCSQNPVDPSKIVPYNIPPSAHPSLGCLNQVSQTMAFQNPNFLVNPQFGVVNSNEVVQPNNQNRHMFVPPTMQQNGLLESPIAAQQLQENLLASHTFGPVQTQETQKNLQPSCFQQSLGNHSKDSGSNISNTNWRNSQHNNFTRNQRESGKRETSQRGFQKSQFHRRANAKGKFRSFNGKGNCNEGAKISVADSTKQDGVECRRSLPLNYTEQEIQQWREERRKNYPSKDKVEKKLTEKQTHSEVIDRDAKTRRQQLKEILAKQAELGVEVAEIPPNYLLESENQVCEKEEEKRVWTKGRSQKKYGKRGKHSQESRFAKKQKLGHKVSFTMPSLDKRKPTLLQKLLSADIKRDKSHLLQVFRFMVMNSFFKDWPEKPLKFPLIIVKETGHEGEVIEEKSSPHLSRVNENAIVEDIECPTKNNTVDDDDNAGDNDNGKNDAEDKEMVSGYVRVTDCIREEIEISEQEEGEITD